MDTSRQAFSEAVGKIDTVYAVQKENVDIQLEARLVKSTRSLWLVSSSY